MSKVSTGMFFLYTFSNTLVGLYPEIPSQVISALGLGSEDNLPAAPAP